VRGLFLLLLKGENGQAYNIVNTEASATIREMAELVAREVCGGKVSVIADVPEDIEKRGYLPDITRRLSADKIMKMGWKPKYGLAQMYKRMIESWREAA
jgi:dTDP-glucose 4,6-dehydratase